MNGIPGRTKFIPLVSSTIARDWGRRRQFMKRLIIPFLIFGCLATHSSGKRPPGYRSGSQYSIRPTGVRFLASSAGVGR